METQTNLNVLKQPAPEIISDESKKDSKKRVFNIPKVGVVDVPNISKTPIADTITLKKQENPHTIYKLTNDRRPKPTFDNMSTLGIIGLGFIAFLSLFKRKK